METDPELGVDRRELDRDFPARFVELLTAHQPKLFGYISTMLLGDPLAADVLQETNHDLWAIRDEYDFERPFLPWAFGFARQKVLVFRRTHCRSRLIFGDEVMSLVDEACAEYASEADDRLLALRKCLQKLDPQQVALIHARYATMTPVKLIAEQLDSSVQNISSRLHRIRKTLAKCIDAKMTAEGR